MVRAAAGLAVTCAGVLRQRRGRVNGHRVVLLAGPGKNGGDALLAGARLRKRGAQVYALLVGDRAFEPGVTALREVGGRVIDAHSANGRETGLSALAKADLVIDGVVGTGGSAGLRAPADELVGAIPSGVPVVAVDLPSGVDRDTGETPERHVRADVTVSCGVLSPSLLAPPASHAAGRLVFIDVGTARELRAQPVVQRLTPLGVGARWPVPRRSDHKYTRGVLGVVAGSDMYPGAAVLACAGAVRAGVGIVRYIGPQRVTEHVLAARPEVVPGLGRVQAWLLGSGVEDDEPQDRAIDEALSSGLPCVVDAGALEACVRRRAAGSRPASADDVLLTPHAGELARMLNMLGHQVTREQVEARPMRHASWLAREADATVLLKGHHTLIAAPDRRLFSQGDGPAWLATAGSGDVLAGIAGALIAGGVRAPEAGAMAALVHGRAAASVSQGGPIVASDIANATPATVAALLPQG
ncbi:MAG: NAD(P)H-hydrate dehydratase [Micromonosporaceae bacterium]|nr:NAD(P)H-hydrate dehydratase [Micromonosporaceae bacterium]